MTITTYTGRKIVPIEASLNEYAIRDIASGLSNTCRYTGQCKRFYSVAQHSVLMASRMPTRELARIALLHDATEAYLGDLVLAVKELLPDYKRLEKSFWQAITYQYNIPYELPQEVKNADKRMLVTEKRQLINSEQHWDIEDYYKPYDIIITPQNPEYAFIAYLRWAEYLDV